MSVNCWVRGRLRGRPGSSLGGWQYEAPATVEEAKEPVQQVSLAQTGARLEPG